MFNNTHNTLNGCEQKLKMNEEVFFEFEGNITQDRIIEVVTYIKEELAKEGVLDTKIHHIIEVVVEVMQNILSYSVDSIDKGNNTYESKGKIVIIRNLNTGEYSIYSCNFIDKLKREKINDRVGEFINLNKDELKELYKKNRRSRRAIHNRGAGLGLIMMARKASKPLGIDFKEIKNEKFLFTLQISLEG